MTEDKVDHPDRYLPPSHPDTEAAKGDLVSDPDHYKGTGGLEPINIIEAFDLPFHLASAVRYVCRFKGKGEALDLHKAMWYIGRYLYMYYDMSPEKILNMNFRKPFDDMSPPPPTVLRTQSPPISDEVARQALDGLAFIASETCGVPSECARDLLEKLEPEDCGPNEK